MTEKVPTSGYILVEVDTPESNRLRQKWITKDRPSRFMVPYSFVRTCIRRERIIPQLFISTGDPLAFFIHESVSNATGRDKAKERILVRVPHLPFLFSESLKLQASGAAV